MVKKLKTDTVEEIMKKEISAVEMNDKLSKLEKERARDKKIIAEYKEREKATARALVLYERKIKYLKEILIDDVLKLCKTIDENKLEFEEISEQVLNTFVKDELFEFKDNFLHYTDSLYEICNKLEANATLTKKDRAFISNKTIVEENAPTDSNARFDRLKQEFAQKIGASVTRGRGRPKKQDQSIVADIGLGKKVERTVDTKQETQSRIDDIFYNAPTKSSVVSSIPQTDDSLFDFNEALNPNVSLKDIMADLMSDKDDEELKTYGENTKMKEIETAQNEQRAELLESGFIKSPALKPQPTQNKTIDPIKKKPTFEKRFLSIQNIMKDVK